MITASDCKAYLPATVVPVCNAQQCYDGRKAVNIAGINMPIKRAHWFCQMGFHALMSGFARCLFLIGICV